jgi:hypothetical protein
VNAEALDDAVSLSVAALREVVDLDWEVTPGAPTWSPNESAEHIADTFICYAGLIAAGPRRAWLPFVLKVEEGATQADRVAIIAATGGVLSAVVRLAPADRRGFHPCGEADPDGFAALGVAEVLLHTWDIRHALHRPWSMPPVLSKGVLARLMPDVRMAGDPSDVLLWATGRLVDPDLGRREEWHYDSSVRPA